MMWILLFIASVAVLGNGEPIVNGHDVLNMRYSFVVQLIIKGTEMVQMDAKTKRSKTYYEGCTGSLIHENTNAKTAIVLTAAHCVARSITKPEVRVYGGQVRKAQLADEFNFNAKMWKMKDFLVHQLYNTHLKVDVALLYVKRKNPRENEKRYQVSVGQFGPIPLEGTTITVTGWGRKADDVEALNLQEGTLAITHRESRKDEHHIKYFIDYRDTRNIANITIFGTATCIGDSGSPIIHQGRIIAVHFKGAMVNKIIGGKTVRVCEGGANGRAVRYDRIKSWIDINVPNKNERQSLVLLRALEPTLNLGS